MGLKSTGSDNSVDLDVEKLSQIGLPQKVRYLS